MRTRILLTAATLLAAPLALAQTAETPVAPPAPAAPPQIEMAPLPEPKLPEPKAGGSDSKNDFRRDLQEIQRDAHRQAQEARRAAREAVRDAERETRDAERSAHDQLRDLGDRIRERVVIAQAGPVLPPLPPIPDIGPAMTIRFKDIDKQLSPDDARRIVDGAIAFKGNKRLKVGKVEADGNDWAKVEIRTIDDSLVDTVRVNRKTGLMERTP
jgi:Spy/CpxP family protein refolding chaperone